MTDAWRKPQISLLIPSCPQPKRQVFEARVEAAPVLIEFGDEAQKVRRGGPWCRPVLTTDDVGPPAIRYGFQASPAVRGEAQRQLASGANAGWSRRPLSRSALTPRRWHLTSTIWCTSGSQPPGAQDLTNH